MAIPTPTSNWTDRSLKGRDFGTSRPAEPTSFEPAERPLGETDAAVEAHDQDELFTRPGEITGPDAEPVMGRSDYIVDAPLTSKADLEDNRHDDLLNAPLTSKADINDDRRDDLLNAPLTTSLDGSARSDLFDAPLTGKADLDGPLQADDRPVTRRESFVEPSAAPLTAGAYAAPSDVVAPRLGDRADDAAYTPAHGQTRRKSNSRALMVGVPLGLAAIAGVGFMALSNGGAEAPARTETTPVAEPVAAAPAAPAAAESSLNGMGVSDLGVAAPSVQTAAVTPPAAPRVQARAEATPPRTPPHAQTRTAPAETQAATPPPAAAAEPIVAEPTPPQPTVTAPPTTGEPLITTEPLPVG